MTGALALTAALMGLAATPHCATMCAAACAAASRPMPRRDGLPVARVGRLDWQGAALASAPVLTGRLLGYAAAGALAASVSQTLGGLGATQAWLRPFWIMAQLLILVLGVWLLARGAFPPSVVDGVERLWRGRRAAQVGVNPAHPAASAPHPARRFLLALLWPAVPCGVLHAALLLAALASSAQEGAWVMLVFGVSSLPGLVLGRSVWLQVARAARGRQRGTCDPVPPPALSARWRVGSGRAVPVPVVVQAVSAVAPAWPVGDGLAVRLAGAMLAGTATWWLIGDRLAPAWLALCA